MATEDVLYQDQAIQITPTRVIVGKMTLLVADLKTASISTVPVRPAASCLFLAIGAAMCGIVVLIIPGAAGMNEAFPNTDTAPIAVFLLVMTVLGILCFAIGAAVPFPKKHRYAVTVTRASGSFNVLVSPKKDYIQTVANVINEAIARRG